MPAVLSFMKVVFIFCMYVHIKWHTPEDVGNTEDAERLVGAGSGLGGSYAGYDGAVTLHPDETSAFHQHPVLTADRLTLKTHCRQRERDRGEIYRCVMCGCMFVCVYHYLQFR